jgi:glucose-6-phosphate isomerase
MNKRNELDSWQRLTAHAATFKEQQMKDLFAENGCRFDDFSIHFDGILFDYSKNRISHETMTLLLRLCEEVDLAGWRDAMFNGAPINSTENRSVLHTALRSSLLSPQTTTLETINKQVESELQKIKAFVEKVRAGDYLGYSGKTITDVVNIGVGGSNLGPQMVTEALKNTAVKILPVHYISNADRTQLINVLKTLNPETTLFIVSSKSFSTVETLTNAKAAVAWFESASGDKKHLDGQFVAVTASPEKAISFGFKTQQIFQLWDWVGGRFSLWSAIGLPIALNLGYEQFEQLLEGAQKVDRHFQETPLSQNIPVIMALIAIWNTTFMGFRSHAILPYDQNLHRLADYLQQAEMESNGKSVAHDGSPIDYPTGAALWGGLGIDGQHAFYQYLHQSNQIIPADFIASVNNGVVNDAQHDLLMSNFFAQTQALMRGVDEQHVRTTMIKNGCSVDSIEALVPHKIHPGNRPTNSFLLENLDSQTLGSLIALYEHKIFVQGVLLGIYSFDQWGVELGKSVAEKIYQELTIPQQISTHESSTHNLIQFYQNKKRSLASTSDR